MDRLSVIACIMSISSLAWAAEPPAITAAALLPRQGASDLVGYISGAADSSRTCDYPQTLQTSGDYIRCCPTTGSCPFFTACSANTLLGGGTSVACDATSTLSCNTGLVQATAGSQAGDAKSYLACWQTSLGTGAFVLAQTPGRSLFFPFFFLGFVLAGYER